ncbi:MAG: hypothetical protein IJ058_04775 [Lachnospiraceae bacterium]|nr:hypothetical protein [Lachnospiraceae bacterium]
MPDEARQYTWSDLRTEYPDEWCALIDVIRGDDRHVPFQSARLLFHGSRDEASDQLIDSDNTQKMLICTDTDSVISLGGVLV